MILYLVSHPTLIYAYIQLVGEITFPVNNRGSIPTTHDILLESTMVGHVLTNT
jgi:hypothetical protein